MKIKVNLAATWKFRIGQVVSFHGDRAVVLSRQCSAMGRQLFYLSMDERDGRQPKWVLGNFLAARDLKP
ncbi:hypothetical protein GGE67_005127 [Rhizobium leucaenae]|nr:hypothetical protein [Rhizobium leucaenae]